MAKLPQNPILRQIAIDTYVAATGGSRAIHRWVYSPAEDRGDVEGRKIVAGVMLIVLVIFTALA